MRIILEANDETAIAKLIADNQECSCVYYDDNGTMPRLCITYCVYSDYDNKVGIEDIKCEQFKDMYVECDYQRIERFASSFININGLKNRL